MNAAQHELHREIGDALFRRRLYVAAAEEWERWLALADETADPRLLAGPLNALTVLHLNRKEPEKAILYSNRAARLAGDLTPLWQVRIALNRIGVLAALGKLDEAMAEVERAEALLGEVSSSALAAGFWLQTCVVRFRRQEWVLMRRAANRAEESAQEAGYRPGEAKAVLNLGIAHLELGMTKLADRDLRRALRMLERYDKGSVAYARTELGRLSYIKGDRIAALEHGRLALTELFLDMATLDKEEVARLSGLFGGIFAAAGQRNPALKYQNRAAAYYSQLGLTADWRRATEAVAHLLSLPNLPVDHGPQEEAFRLDFLTAVLDLTDDLESVDPYLRGHSERVASLSQMVGRSLGLSEAQIHELTHAARLHDVGKVAVDADILLHPGRLTEVQYRRVMMHPVIGEEMMRPYALSPAQLAAIRHHHERWRGGGYPDGIMGEQIPLLARIIAVADAYDAMTSERVYRKALTHGEALSQLKRMAGKDLDPELVAVFLDLHRV
jgi:HD-GYP domain-containing protein (c-di-GMP phosphodiesterase class II)